MGKERLNTARQYAHAHMRTHAYIQKHKHTQYDCVEKTYSSLARSLHTEFGHLHHLDARRHHSAQRGAGAERQKELGEIVVGAAARELRQVERGDDGDGHADHACDSAAKRESARARVQRQKSCGAVSAREGESGEWKTEKRSENGVQNDN